MYDIFSLLPTNEVKCLDYGHVRLLDSMPRLCPEGQTAEFAIVQAARVSYGEGTKTVNEDIGLIRYLMRHKHSTPTEMIEFKFHCKMPIFVARQWIRHRTASVNEISARYSVMKDEFYVPEQENVRIQSLLKKQCSSGSVSEQDANNFINNLDYLCDQTYSAYEEAQKAGVAREQSRMILPVNLYTEWYWKIDLHNLLHFLALRCDPHAQWEIRVFAEAMLQLITPLIPNVIKAWNDYHENRNAMKFSATEIEALVSTLNELEVSEIKNIQSTNKGELSEWKEKLQKLGLKLKD